MKFYKDYRHFLLKEDQKLELVSVGSHGDTLGQLIENCVLNIVDMDGDEGPARTLGDLSKWEIEKIVDDMKDFVYNETNEGENI